MSLSDPRLPASFLQPGSSSFSEFLSAQSPDLLPGRRALPQGAAATAWEQSLALENRGDFTAAKQLLVDAFGASPSTRDCSEVSGT